MKIKDHHFGVVAKQNKFYAFIFAYVAFCHCCRLSWTSPGHTIDSFITDGVTKITFWDFVHRHKSYNYLILYNKQHHGKYCSVAFI